MPQHPRANSGRPSMRWQKRFTISRVVGEREQREPRREPPTEKPKTARGTPARGAEGATFADR
jgi:hypothetical protein